MKTTDTVKLAAGSSKEDTVSTFDATTINIYKSPEQGDQVKFADGSIWTIKQREQMSWGLYTDDNYLHSAVGLHRGMIDFCASINEQGRFLSDLLAVNYQAIRGEHYV